MGIEDNKPDVSADLSGKTCPYTVMGTRDALKPL
jgi:TusA-related sulfurtransferase